MSRHRAVRAVLVLLGVLGVLAACSTSPSAAPEAPTSTRRVTHEFGTTDVPTQPRRIVALDEPGGLAALSVGIVPAVVYTSYGTTVARDVLAAAGSRIVTIPVTSFVAPETVLAERPDLVLFSSAGDPRQFTALAPAVPTLVLPSTTLPWRTTLDAVASAFGREQQAGRIRAALERRITTLAADPRVRGKAISSLIPFAGAVSLAAPDSPDGLLVREAGFTRPLLPDGTTTTPGLPYVPLSPEKLTTADADVVTVFSGSSYDAAAVDRLPTLGRLRGSVVRVTGEMWFSTSPFAIWWMLDDLDRIAAGRPTEVGTDAQWPQRFRTYQQATGS